jgi:hypothetical protein
MDAYLSHRSCLRDHRVPRGAYEGSGSGGG